MTDVEDLVAEIREPERRNDVPDAEKADFGIRFDDLLRARLPDAPLLQVMAEVERRWLRPG